MNTHQARKSRRAAIFLLTLGIAISVTAFFASCSDGLFSSILNPDRDKPAMSSAGATGGTSGGGTGSGTTAGTGGGGATAIVIDPSLSIPDAQGNTQLGNAITSNNLQTVQDLISKGADPNVTSNGKTPLELAIEAGNLDLVKLLLANGANSNTPSNGKTPLELAIESGNSDLVKVLLTHGANPNTESNGITPLQKAIETGSFDIVKLLIDNGANVNTPDANGNTPAYNAASSDSKLAILKYLVETGHADLSIRGQDGMSPFIKASSANALENVKYLLTQGQNVNQLDTNNHSALYWAITNKNYETFHYLVNYAGIDRTGLTGYTQTLADAAPTNTTLSTMLTELLVYAPALQLTVNEITATGSRPYYAAFNIQTNQDPGYKTKNYYLALKASSGTKPTSTEILNGFHYKRNLKSTPINIYGWAPITTTYATPANGNAARAMMLVPSTQYILWGMPENGNDAAVIELKRFTTTATPADGAATTNIPLDTSIVWLTENSNPPVFALNAGEPILVGVNVSYVSSASIQSNLLLGYTFRDAIYTDANIKSFVTYANSVGSGSWDISFNISSSIVRDWTFKMTTNY